MAGFVPCQPGTSVWYPITSGTTINPGDLVGLSANRAILLASGASSTGKGVAIAEGGTGNSAGTVGITVQKLGPGDRVECDGVSGATHLPGDQLDINATSDGLAADSDHDVTVERVLDNGRVQVSILASRMADY